MKSHVTFMTLTLEGLVVLCLLQRVHNIGNAFIVHASEVEIWNSEIENWNSKFQFRNSVIEFFGTFANPPTILQQQRDEKIRKKIDVGKITI